METMEISEGFQAWLTAFGFLALAIAFAILVPTFVCYLDKLYRKKDKEEDVDI